MPSAITGRRLFSCYTILCAKSCDKDSSSSYNDIVTGDQEDTLWTYWTK